MTSPKPKVDWKAFVPTSRREMNARGWQQLDVLFICGDAYIDHPAFGLALLARLLEADGWRVGIVSQPDWKRPDAFKVMGRPRICAAVSAGAMDSMVNHYTAARKIRRNDAYTPGGQAGARPNRATIAYTVAVKAAFKGLPVVIGGLEASLRRLAHYDYWQEKVRRSILVDSKADLLVYGMAETALRTIVRRLSVQPAQDALEGIRGTARMQRQPPEKSIVLPSYETVCESPDAYNQAFRRAAQAQHGDGRILAQAHGDRWVVIQPPAPGLSTAELDRIYALPFQRMPHFSHSAPIPAFEQIRWSITTHRGCYGGCAFCAIGHHQGKQIQSRSIDSIVAETRKMAQSGPFRGTISDLGGPTANMYATGCGSDKAYERCRRSSCLFPKMCPHLQNSDQMAVALLRKVRRVPGVKHAFVASGIRYDLLACQPDYFQQLLSHHVSGRLKIAPETTVPKVARVMRKPGPELLLGFIDFFRKENRRMGRRAGLVPYMISGHPGCTLSDMLEVALFLRAHDLRVEQVQEFTPTPGSLSTCIWHTGEDPFSGQKIYIPRGSRERKLQKALLLYHMPEQRKHVKAALAECGQLALAGRLLDGKQRFAHTPKSRSHSS